MVPYEGRTPVIGTLYIQVNVRLSPANIGLYYPIYKFQLLHCLGTIGILYINQKLLILLCFTIMLISLNIYLKFYFIRYLFKQTPFRKKMYRTCCKNVRVALQS